MLNNPQFLRKLKALWIAKVIVNSQGPYFINLNHVGPKSIADDLRLCLTILSPLWIKDKAITAFVNSFLLPHVVYPNDISYQK